MARTRPFPSAVLLRVVVTQYDGWFILTPAEWRALCEGMLRSGRYDLTQFRRALRPPRSLVQRVPTGEYGPRGRVIVDYVARPGTRLVQPLDWEIDAFRDELEILDQLYDYAGRRVERVARVVSAVGPRLVVADLLGTEYGFMDAVPEHFTGARALARAFFAEEQQSGADACPSADVRVWFVGAGCVVLHPDGRCTDALT